jgi:hypothetical protein
MTAQNGSNSSIVERVRYTAEAGILLLKMIDAFNIALDSHLSSHHEPQFQRIHTVILSKRADVNL